MFATRAFRPGERIRRVNIIREITPESPLRPEDGELIEHCAYPDGRVMLWGAPDRYINHGCDPNAWEQQSAGASYIVARRTIAPGEEIRCDYNINIAGGTSWPCRCGASRCGGMVVGDFFLLPAERQREYAPYLAPWFVERHREHLRTLGLLDDADGRADLPT